MNNSDTVFDMPSNSNEVSINGHKYNVSTYTIADYAKSKDMLRTERREEIEEIKDLFSDSKERDIAIKEKLVTITDNDIMNYMNGAIGASKAIWGMMNRLNKDFMDLDEFSQNVSMEKIGEIATLMMEPETKKKAKRGRPVKD